MAPPPPPPAASAATSFTRNLLSHDPATFQRATQSPFLAAAARGQVSKDVLGRWLANDRLYIHNYIRGTGQLLATNPLPVPSSETPSSPLVRLVDWLIEALLNVRREERFFIDTAGRFGIAVDLPTAADGTVADEAKLEGLRRFEALFSDCGPRASSPVLPWLEAAIIFWGTEKCYLDAWTWARSQMEPGEPASDSDGGALRTEFIPNWSSPEFASFVDRLGDIIDDAVDQQVRHGGDDLLPRLTARAERTWRDVLAAEEAFWPSV